MLDMGFLPDIRRILRHLPARRQTLFFSATMPAPIVTLTREMLRNPATINLERQAAPAVGITQAVYPVPQELKSALLVALLKRGEMQEALVFTRTKHRANRLAELPGPAWHQGGADPRQPLAAAAHRGARRLQEREVPGAGGHRYRRPRHRCRGARPRGELRRAAGARRLHPPGGPDRAGRSDRRRLHPGVARGGGGRAARHRARDRKAPAAGDRPRLRLQRAAGGAVSRCRLAERIAAIRAKKAEDRARSKAKEAPRGTAARRPGPARPGHRGGGRPRNGGSIRAEPPIRSIMIKSCSERVIYD